MNKNERDMIFNSFNYLIDNWIFLSIFTLCWRKSHDIKKKLLHLIYNDNVYNVEF